MKLKSKEDIVTLLGTLKAGSVINNTSTSEENIVFIDNDGSTITLNKSQYMPKFDVVADSTPTNVVLTKSSIVQGLETGVMSFAKSIQIGSGVGTLAGLGLAYYRKSGVLGYIGYMVGLGLLGGIIGGYMGGKKALVKTAETVIK
jgi:hypothetical protein